VAILWTEKFPLQRIVRAEGAGKASGRKHSSALRAAAVLYLHFMAFYHDTSTNPAPLREMVSGLEM